MGKKEKIQLAVTGALVLMLIALTVRGVRKVKAKLKSRVAPYKTFSSSSPGASPVGAGETPEEKKKKKIAQKGLYGALEEETRDVRITRDPFSKKAYIPTGDVTAHDLLLIGIAWDPEDPKAIVNNRIVEVGSQVGKYTILDIQRDKVIFSDGVRRFEVYLDL